MGRVWPALVAVIVMVETVAAVPFWVPRTVADGNAAERQARRVAGRGRAPRGPMTVIVSLTSSARTSIGTAC